MSALVYETIYSRDPGSAENSGSIRVREAVSLLLFYPLLLSSINNPVVVTDSIQVSLSSPGSVAVSDTIVARNTGDTALRNPTKVREFIQTNLSGGVPVNPSRAVVDIIISSDFVYRVLNPTYRLVSDLTYIRDDPGQDQPVAVRESVTVSLSGAQNLRLVTNTAYTLESVNATLRTALISRSVSDNIFIRDEVIRSSSKYENVVVSESITRNLYGGLITANINDTIAITELVSNVLDPIYAETHSSNSVVSDLAIGFLSAPQPQTKIIIENSVVTDNVIRKHSHLTVFVYDTIGVTDRKVPGNREYWWKYSWRWRG